MTDIVNSDVKIRPTMEAQVRTSMLKETDVFTGTLMPVAGDTQAQIDAKMTNLKLAIEARRRQERPWPPVVTIAFAERSNDFWEGFDLGSIAGAGDLRKAINKAPWINRAVFIITGGRYGSI